MSRLTPSLANFLTPRLLGLSVAFTSATIDLLTKSMALTAEASGVLPLWLVPGQIGFHFAWNRGMSFSLLNDVAWGPYLLGALAVAACIWFVRWLGEHTGWPHQIGLGLLIGGAVGNLADRLQHGAVVDFLLLNPFHLFPYTFNVADTAITFGVALLLLDSFLRRP